MLVRVGGRPQLGDFKQTLKSAASTVGGVARQQTQVALQQAGDDLASKVAGWLGVSSPAMAPGAARAPRTNWTPWILGGAGLVGAYLVFRR